MLNLRHYPRLFLTVFLCLIACASLRADLLWYSGDPVPTNLQANILTTNPTPDPFVDFLQIALEDFTVDSPSGWNIDAVFSNNALLVNAPSFNMATWSIRTGVGPGSPGTVIAGGTSPATVTFNGVNITDPDFGIEQRGATVTVAGLNLHLDPGTYWLQVTPLMSSSTTFFTAPFGGFYVPNSILLSTNGTNGVGTPLNNNNLTYQNFIPLNSTFVNPFNGSFGILSGVAQVPEPGTVALLLGAGVSSLGLLSRRRAWRR